MQLLRDRDGGGEKVSGMRRWVVKIGWSVGGGIKSSAFIWVWLGGIGFVGFLLG